MPDRPALIRCEDLRVRAGSARWRAVRRTGIGASEISAALGLSPYSSPTDLYYQKVGALPDERDNASMEWGRLLESAVLQRFAQCHPEFMQQRLVARLYRSREPGRRWQLATPDAVFFDPRVPFAMDKRVPFVRVDGQPCLPTVVQVKTAHDRSEWGQERSDEIPIQYRCQVIQEMDVVGAQVAWLPVLFKGRDYREYRVEFNERDAEILRMRGREFWGRVERREPPPVDGHRATARALRDAFGVEADTQVQVPADLIKKMAQVAALERRLDDLSARYEARLRATMGPASQAVVGSTVVARRSQWDQRQFNKKAFEADHPELAAKYTDTVQRGRLSVTHKEWQ